MSNHASSTERRERILAEILAKRHVSARDLASSLAVSEATVRRDLRNLSASGEIELVYGGATTRRHTDHSFRSKSERNVDEKRVIGRLAADLVGDDEQIFIDSGTTCFEMAPFLARRKRLSVIVNSTRLAMELDTPGLSVIMLGGQYRPDRMDTIGPLAASTLNQLRGYVCFIGADGLDMSFGLAAADIDSADIYRRAVQNARQTVLLVDHTKFSATSLFKIVDWESVSQVVTDRPPTADWADFLAARSIELIYPSESPNHN